MQLKNNNHGGKREGAGRKSKGRSKVTTTFTLSPDVVEYLKTKGRAKSEYIEELILANIKKSEA